MSKKIITMIIVLIIITGTSVSLFYYNKEKKFQILQNNCLEKKGTVKRFNNCAPCLGGKDKICPEICEIIKYGDYCVFEDGTGEEVKVVK
ncbi:MAG: hypothetical protein Q7J14_00225 [Candidatus Magasanikbacteria bacterium]|nr:hypothetical protein [Candidatus Magasanikbacteria bacterium]